MSAFGPRNPMFHFSKSPFFSRKEEQSNGLGANAEAARVFQASTECESSEDAFRWRKYGQKAVNGNLFPM